MTTDDAYRKLRDQLGQAVRKHLTHGEDAAFADLSASLEYLLGWHWDDANLRPSHGFDGLGHAVISNRSADGIEVIGFMYIAETEESEWFAAAVSLVPGADRVESYRMKFGLQDTPPFETEPSRADFERALERVSTFHWAHEFQG